MKLASVSRLTVTGSWTALITLQHYVKRIELRETKVTLPANPPPAETTTDSKTSETTIGELLADGAVLNIGRIDRADPLQFKFGRLLLRNS